MNTKETVRDWWILSLEFNLICFCAIDGGSRLTYKKVTKANMYVIHYNLHIRTRLLLFQNTFMSLETLQAKMSASKL